MAPLENHFSSPEWSLLSRLRKQLLRYPEARPSTGKEKRQRRKPSSIKNRCSRMNIKLQHFLNNQYSVLEEVGLQNDETSGNTIQKAMAMLPRLCSILDNYANRHLSTTPVSGKYRRLLSAIMYLECGENLEKPFGLFSHIDAHIDHTQRCHLFPIDTSNKRNNKSIIQEGLALFEELDQHVRDLKPTSTSITSWTGQQNTATQERSFWDDDTTYTRFICQTTAALHGTFTRFEQCREPHHVHRVLLKIPSVETELASEVRLFLALTDDHAWQEACVRVDEDDGMIEMHKPSLELCARVQSARDQGTRLVAHVKYSGGVSSYENCIIVDAPPERRTLQEKSRLAAISSTTSSLEQLLSDQHFRQNRDGIFNTEFVSFSQRRHLSAKLVLGMLITMGRYHAVKAWDPTHIYVVHKENEYIEVSCTVEQSSDVARFDWHTENPFTDNPEHEDQPSNPSIVLMSLAKTLVEICEGVHITQIKLNPDSNMMTEWEALRKRADAGVRNPKAFELHPIFEAAQSCLNFHESYHAARKYTKAIPSASSDSYSVAKHTFISEVLSKIWYATNMNHGKATMYSNSFGTLFDDAEDLESTS
jgi:hypothetical protein